MMSSKLVKVVDDKKRSSSVQKTRVSKNLIPSAQELNTMSMSELKQFAKKNIPEYKDQPIRGWSKLSAQQKKQMTKLRKEAIIYAID